METPTVLKTFKYQLQPTAEQEGRLAFVVRRCAELYNAGLQERREAWRMRGVSVKQAMQSAQLPGIKAVRPEYQDIHSQVLQDVLTRLDRAFQAFFRRVKQGEKPGYPRFQAGSGLPPQDRPGASAPVRHDLSCRPAGRQPGPEPRPGQEHQ